MYLDGLEYLPLGSLRDRIRNTLWYRREQRQIFESLIVVYASAISINPDITKKVTSAINEYIELIVPGSSEYRKKEEESLMAKNSAALATIYAALEQHQQGIPADKLRALYKNT